MSDPASAAPATMTIVLPIPSRKVTPNGRAGWRAKAKLVRKYRSLAFWRMLELLGGEKPPRPVAYSYRYHWGSNRRDDDNAIASGKAYLDGICEALKIDDRELRFRELIHEKDRTEPRMEVILHLAP
ncbi:hypothetical protein OKA04_23300 [Luteolibacter flavescens]|uniref:Uncharacterized protein n=1 Tax=Luteolibacter flavescens TaxID=1859460 RepID=A0ABT3FVR4_9BACT|nr:hypothetical protein [Luteolibacter flavescens]MCW1887683.1 hypothetical protein [Luteolibacter flavescens]